MWPHPVRQQRVPREVQQGEGRGHILLGNKEHLGRFNKVRGVATSRKQQRAPREVQQGEGRGHILLGNKEHLGRFNKVRGVATSR